MYVWLSRQVQLSTSVIHATNLLGVTPYTSNRSSNKDSSQPCVQLLSQRCLFCAALPHKRMLLAAALTLRTHHSCMFHAFVVELVMCGGWKLRWMFGCRCGSVMFVCGYAQGCPCILRCKCEHMQMQHVKGSNNQILCKCDPNTLNVFWPSYLELVIVSLTKQDVVKTTLIPG